MKKNVLLLFSWLCWGFALGTFILLFPLRKTVDFARGHNWAEVTENLLVFFYIVLLAVVSYLLARFTTSRTLHGNTSKGGKALHISVPVVAAIIALFVMLNPAWNNTGTKEAELNTQFTIGPYPTEDKIHELKKAGYTAIISLLHPAVVPFEPKLLGEETTYANRQKLELISIPMLPWISENEEAINKLRTIVRQAKGKYYIHCYLGKDRVNVARRIIEQESSNKIVLEQGLKHRSIDDIEAFERGKIYKLAPEVYFTPFPTDEEYFGYIVATDFKQVVALSDLSDGQAVARTDKEKESLQNYNIAYKRYDVNERTGEERLKAIADSVKDMGKPLLIHTFRSDQPIAQLFMKVYAR